MNDVGEGEADDPGQGLGVEQDEQPDESVDRGDGRVGVDAADQGRPAVTDRGGVAVDARRKPSRGLCGWSDGPYQEGPNIWFGRGGGGVPAVEFGLGRWSMVAAAAGEVGQERGGWRSWLRALWLR